MARIFLSYSRADREHAQRIVEVLETRGWSVWWDSRLRGGQEWEREIETQLESANCVLVLWSTTSVESNWVLAEAGDGLARGILIPVRIADVRPPLRYRAVQTIDLMEWFTGSDKTSLGRLVDDVRVMLERAIDAGSRPPGSPDLQPARGRANVRPPPQPELPAVEPRSRAAPPRTSGLPSRVVTPTPAPAPRSATRVRRRASAKLQAASDRVESITTSRSRPSSRPPRESRDGVIGAFVQLLPDAEMPALPMSGSRRSDVVAVAVRPGDLPRLAQHASVMAIEHADPISADDNAPGPLQARRPRPALESGHEGTVRSADVVIGIIGFGGFDFAHPDFQDGSGRTRFIRIWDQGGQSRAAPKQFGFGSEIAAERMNAAIKSAVRFNLAAQELEPQSEMSRGSPATHLASVAAGRVGLCPHATIAGVLLRRHGASANATAIAHAIDYLFELGTQLKKPVSIVIGAGTRSATYDSETGIAKYLDAALIQASRCICVGASEPPQLIPGVIPSWQGRFGRVHTSGRIREAGLTERLEWIIPGNGTIDLHENEIHIWYERRDRFVFSLRPPDGPWIGPIELGASVEQRVLENGTVVSLYHDRLAQAGHNYIACYLTPHASSTAMTGVRAGTWIIRLQGIEVRDGTYHGWVGRDDTGAIAIREDGLDLPPHFSRRSGVPGFAMTGLACARRVVTVGNLDGESETIHPASGRGPTREGYRKPEISVVGTNIVGANGFDSPNPPWIARTGTAVAAAYAAGTAGLMLALNSRLSASEITEIMTRTATPLPGSDYGWHDDTGFGALDLGACLNEARRIGDRRPT